MINFNESWFIGLNTSNAIESESISPVQLWILSDLYYFNPNIHEKMKMINFNESGFIGLSTPNAFG